MSDLSNIFPCGRIGRRDLFKSAAGFMGCFMGGALGTMWAEDGHIPDVRFAPTLPVKAKSVIFLYMCGGVSHIDTFDPKDNKWAGKWFPTCSRMSAAWGMISRSSTRCGATKETTFRQ